MRLHVAQQPVHRLPVRGIPTEQPVRTQQPEIAGARDRCVRNLRCVLFPWIGTVLQQRVDLACLEAEPGQVDTKLGQVADLQRQQVPVPAGLIGEPVVGEDVGPALRLGQVSEFDHTAPGPCRAAVRPAAVHARRSRRCRHRPSTGLQNPNSRIDPAIRATWRLRMRPCVPDVGHQRLDRAPFDQLGAQGCRLVPSLLFRCWPSPCREPPRPELSAPSRWLPREGNTTVNPL